MLSELSIKNYALIDNLQVQFDSGLTIITGETGAGKSILLGGLGLVLGRRVDFSHINDITKKCIIEAIFDIDGFNLKSFFETNDIDFEINTILRREVLPSGKSRAFINDSPVNLSVLSALGEQLIDVHSQQQTQELTSDGFQFQVLDSLAKNHNSIKTYQQTLKLYSTTQKKLTELINLKSKSQKDTDYNTFLLNELMEVNLHSIDMGSLELEYNSLSNVELIQSELALANQIISSEDLGVATNLLKLKQVFYKLMDISSAYQPFFERIQSASIEINDIFSEIEFEQSKVNANPSRLSEIDNILQRINNLFSKHNVNSVQELIGIQSELESKVDSLASIESSIMLTEKALKSHVKQLDDESLKIREKRKSVISKLVTQLEANLSDLGMSTARFKISLNPSDSFLNNGKDYLEFLFNANKGGQFLPLKKAASGGELSRIMLAVKYIISKYQKLPTIMFDEIDTGLSGEIAHKMGDIMNQMSLSMQVFSITHLPQIAVKGKSHFKVFKKDSGKTTVTSLKKLSKEERLVEIAQMLGGEQVSDSAIAHAQQLLN